MLASWRGPVAGWTTHPSSSLVQQPMRQLSLVPASTVVPMREEVVARRALLPASAQAHASGVSAPSPVDATPPHPSIFALAQQQAASSASSFQGRAAPEDRAALQRIFRFTTGEAACSVGEALATKYNMDQDNRQRVVSVTNLVTYEQVWYNEVRSRKPQTFKAGGSGVVDPTGDGGVGKCDFCDWGRLTAQDPWGRFETEHAVTASNLFKYGEPYHGLALFKHHHPLTWEEHQLRDLLAVSAAWFRAAGKAEQEAQQGVPPTNGHSRESSSNGDGSLPQQSRSLGPLYGFFIWNTLARAGASQFHGHAQLMATRIPVPAQALLDDQSAAYARTHGGRSYLTDLLLAHRAAGLLRGCWVPDSGGTGGGSREAGMDTATAHRDSSSHDAVSGHRAWVSASLTPTKDMELLIAVEVQPRQQNHASNLGSSTKSSSGITHTRESGTQTNGQVSNSDVGSSQQPAASCSEHREHTGLESPAFCRALHACLRTLIDRMGVESFNVGILNVPTCSSHSTQHGRQSSDSSSFSSSGQQQTGNTGLQNLEPEWQSGDSSDSHKRISQTSLQDSAGSVWLPGWEPQGPLLLARLVSRGRMSQPASDYGCLEVIGRASIGHTDPYAVMAAVEEQLGAACVRL